MRHLPHLLLLPSLLLATVAYAQTPRVEPLTAAEKTKLEAAQKDVDVERRNLQRYRHSADRYTVSDRHEIEDYLNDRLGAARSQVELLKRGFDTGDTQPNSAEAWFVLHPLMRHTLLEDAKAWHQRKDASFPEASK